MGEKKPRRSYVGSTSLVCKEMDRLLAVHYEMPNRWAFLGLAGRLGKNS